MQVLCSSSSSSSSVFLSSIPKGGLRLKWAGRRTWIAASRSNENQVKSGLKSHTHTHTESRADIACVSTAHIQNKNNLNLENSLCIFHEYMKIVICIFTWGLNGANVASCVMCELAQLPFPLDNNEMIQSLIWRMKKLTGWETACVGIFINGIGLKGANIFPWHIPF